MAQAKQTKTLMTISAKQLRIVSRWVHIVAAIFLGIYIYSPWSRYLLFSRFMQWGVMPLLTITGIAMWQQAATLRLLNRLVARKH